MTLFIFHRNIKGHIPSILLTHLVPDGFLNMGQGFSFIPGHRQESLNYLSSSSAVSGGAVDLVQTTQAWLSVHADPHLDASRHKASRCYTNPGYLAGLHQ